MLHSVLPRGLSYTVGIKMLFIICKISEQAKAHCWTHSTKIEEICWSPFKLIRFYIKRRIHYDPICLHLFVWLLRMKELCASMLCVKVHGLEIGHRYKTHISLGVRPMWCITLIMISHILWYNLYMELPKTTRTGKLPWPWGFYRNKQASKPLQQTF